MSAPLTGLRVAVQGNAVYGMCGCGEPLGATGVVVLPERGTGPVRAFCGPCLRAGREEARSAGERGVSFLEALLLGLVAQGCRPRAEAESEEAA